MIHGQDRDEVLAQVVEAAVLAGLEQVRREVLFSTRRFKQRGACYAAPTETAKQAEVA